MKDTNYDVFLSITGRKRKEKDVIKKYLDDCKITYYDSSKARGTNTLEKLEKSTVYMVFFSMSLITDDEEYINRVIDEFEFFKSHKDNIKIMIVDLDNFLFEDNNSKLKEYFDLENIISSTSHIGLYNPSFDAAFEEKREKMANDIMVFTKGANNIVVDFKENYSDFEIFLSWTGSNRKEKNIVKEFLVKEGFKVFDSDVECRGDFKKECKEGIERSQVYILFLSRDLLSDEKGFVTYVRDEFEFFNNRARAKKINIINLELDDFFSNPSCVSELKKELNKNYLFFKGTSINLYDPSFDIAFDEKKQKIVNDTLLYRDARLKGKPIINGPLDNGLIYDKFDKNDIFYGRKSELQALKHFIEESNDKSIVVNGTAGIGKTYLIQNFDLCSSLFIQKIFIPTEKNMQVSIEDLLLPNIKYDQKTYRLLSVLSKRQQIDYQLKLLKSIDERQFVIIDNIDDFDDDLRNKIDNLFSCKIIYTSRSSFRTDDNLLPVEKLNFDDAYKMFKSISNKELEEDIFKSYYEEYAGNTLALSILAKIYKENDNIDFKKNKVVFDHNDFNIDKGTTIDNHIVELFKLSFDQLLNLEADDRNGIVHLLKNISILGEYSISLDDLYKYIDMDSASVERSIKLLEKYGGWIKVVDNVVYIERIISDNVPNIIRTQIAEERDVFSDDLDLISYVIDKSNNNYLYTDILRSVNNVFYSLKDIAKLTHKLSFKLFDEYAKLCEQTKNYTPIIYQLNELATYLDDEYAKARVLTYYSLNQIRINPTKVEWFEPFINSLEYCSTREHKWILSILSISMGYYQTYIKDISKERLVKCLDNALAILSKEYYDNLDEVKKEKRELYNIELYLFLEYYMCLERPKKCSVVLKKYFKNAKKYKMKDFITFGKTLKLFSMVNDIYKNDFKLLKIMLKPLNIFKSIKGYMATRKLMNLESRNPVIDSASTTSWHMMNLISNYELDVENIVYKQIEMQKYLYDNGLTLLSSSDIICGSFYYIDRVINSIFRKDKYMIKSFQDSINDAVKEVKLMNINSIDKLRKIEAYYKITEICGNDNQYELSKMIFDYYEKESLKETPELIDAYLKMYYSCNDTKSLPVSIFDILDLSIKLDYQTSKVLVYLINYESLSIEQKKTMLPMVDKYVTEPNEQITAFNLLLKSLKKYAEFDDLYEKYFVNRIVGNKKLDCKIALDSIVWLMLYPYLTGDEEFNTYYGYSDRFFVNTKKAIKSIKISAFDKKNHRLKKQALIICDALKCERTKNDKQIVKLCTKALSVGLKCKEYKYLTPIAVHMIKGYDDVNLLLSDLRLGKHFGQIQKDILSEDFYGRMQMNFFYNINNTFQSKKYGMGRIKYFNKSYKRYLLFIFKSQYELSVKYIENSRVGEFASIISETAKKPTKTIVKFSEYNPNGSFIGVMTLRDYSFNDDLLRYLYESTSVLYYPESFDDFAKEGSNSLEDKLNKIKLLFAFANRLLFLNGEKVHDIITFFTKIILGGANSENSPKDVYYELIKIGLSLKENQDFNDISIDDYISAADNAIENHEFDETLKPFFEGRRIKISDVYNTLIVAGTRDLLLTLKKKIRISPSDQFYEGMKYLFGKGVDKDLNMAVYWLNESVKQNYPQAFGMLASCYLNGQGVEIDKQKGLELLEKGARLDDKESICLLGARCFDEKDYPRAIELLERVKDTHPVAQYIIGNCYLTGTYYDMDEVKGLEYIKKAADKGFKIAVEKLKALEIMSNSEKYENIDPDAVCPCGSGLKFKYCHGAKK